MSIFFQQSRDQNPANWLQTSVVEEQLHNLEC